MARTIRVKRKRSTRRMPFRQRRRTGATLRRRKATKMGRKWKAPGIPRTIISADFQRRSQAVNFEYLQSWSVTPAIMAVKNSLQFITFVMNDPTDIFGANLPFAANLSNAQQSIPDYAAAQQSYGVTGSLVDRQQVAHFAAWSKRYEKACVIGTKVTIVLRPKMPIRTATTNVEAHQHVPTSNQQAATYDEATYSANEQTFPLDASRVATFVTNTQPFASNDPESINTLTKLPELIGRSGVKQSRMSYTPAGKDGAMTSIGYSPKKFWHIKDIKDNSKHWSDIDTNTGNLTMTNDGQGVKKVYGIVAIQKEELNSPTGATAPKAQHDYFIEVKYSTTVLFKDPYEVPSTNIPTATAHAPMDVHDSAEF